MVLVEGKKYACDTCIKGHRSSACKHTDRPLFEIKRKGRPITQCGHCRTLRKTKQVHVKCVCELKEEDGEGPQGGKKDQAAFPEGLPEELEASVALQLLSEGSSDSDHGGSSHVCDCKAGGSCYCATPRALAAKNRKSEKSREVHASGGVEVVTDASNAFRMPEGHGHHHFRPVLPRPPPGPPSEASSFLPSSSNAIVHGPRHHGHGAVLFSPYTRAYEHTHVPDEVNEEMSRPTGVPDSEAMSDELYQIFVDASASQGPLDQTFSNSQVGWLPTTQQTFALCNCGETCACAGCIEHQGPEAVPFAPGQSCVHPPSCTSCFSCSILSFPAPPSEQGMVSSGYDTSQSYQTLDDWLARIPEIPNRPLQAPTSSLPSVAEQIDPALMQTYSNQLWQNLLMPSIPNPTYTEDTSRGGSDCCGGQCKCPVGQCTCPVDCCGCCQGCQCNHEEESGRNGLTFAISGERGTCCSGHNSTSSMGVDLGRSEGFRSGLSFAGGQRASRDRMVTVGFDEMASDTASLSRASSTSSQSSRRSLGGDAFRESATGAYGAIQANPIMMPVPVPSTSLLVPSSAAGQHSCCSTKHGA